MPLHPVQTDHNPEPVAASSMAEQDDATGLHIVVRPSPSGPRSRAGGPPPRLHLGPQRPVASDAVELAARSFVAPGFRHRRLGLRHLTLEMPDLAKALVLAERGFDHAPDRRLVAH